MKLLPRIAGGLLVITFTVALGIPAVAVAPDPVDLGSKQQPARRISAPLRGVFTKLGSRQHESNYTRGVGLRDPPRQPP